MLLFDYCLMCGYLALEGLFDCCIMLLVVLGYNSVAVKFTSDVCVDYG